MFKEFYTKNPGHGFNSSRVKKYFQKLQGPAQAQNSIVLSEFPFWLSALEPEIEPNSW